MGNRHRHAALARALLPEPERRPGNGGRNRSRHRRLCASTPPDGAIQGFADAVKRGQYRQLRLRCRIQSARELAGSPNVGGRTKPHLDRVLFNLPAQAKGASGVAHSCDAQVRFFFGNADCKTGCVKVSFSPRELAGFQPHDVRLILFEDL